MVLKAVAQSVVLLRRNQWRTFDGGAIKTTEKSLAFGYKRQLDHFISDISF